LKKQPSLSVVIPVFNSSEIIGDLVAQLAQTLPPLTDDYEVILIDDGSQDTSWEKIGHASQKHPWLKGIKLMRNYGQHNALLCGIRAAQNDVIITMDDDLQHLPQDIHLLLSKLREGYDVVYGTPQKEEHPFWRKLASKIIRRALQKIMGVETAYNASAFRALKSEVREAFSDFKDPFVSIDVLLSWGTKDFASVLVRHHPRTKGPSNYTLRKLFAHALDMVTGFSSWPLRIASLVGFGFTLFGFFILFYVLIRYIIEGGSVPGFPFLASIIAIFSGAQLFSLGIIGEYLARIHFRSMRRPYCTVRQTVGFHSREGEDQHEL